jgi:uncharacterized protein YbjT (DUF2867 family)
MDFICSPLGARLPPDRRYSLIHRSARRDLDILRRQGRWSVVQDHQVELAYERNLVRAASWAGTRHLVYISVVGADRIPVVSGVNRAMFGYFGSKLGAERAVADSGLQWTTLRAAQFHDLSLTTARRMARLPVIPVTAHRLPARSDSWSKRETAPEGGFPIPEV